MHVQFYQSQSLFWLARVLKLGSFLCLMWCHAIFAKHKKYQRDPISLFHASCVDYSLLSSCPCTCQVLVKSANSLGYPLLWGKLSHHVMVHSSIRRMPLNASASVCCCCCCCCRCRRRCCCCCRHLFWHTHWLYNVYNNSNNNLIIIITVYCIYIYIT